MPSPVLPKHKDEAQGQLQSGISAAGLTITLKSGEGAEFPQPYTGSCSSTGSSTTLNDTGDLAGVAQYDYIRNVTDGSWAICLTTGTNSITTTRLKGGTLNVWTSGDEWRVNEFVITLADITTNAYGVQTINASEKALIKSRSSDVLTVATGGRGYDSSSAQTWDADDYVNLFVASVTPEGFRGIVAELASAINTNITDIATRATEIDNIESNATFYVAAAGSSNAFTGTLSSMPAAYTTGERLYFKANHDITGAATFNRASLGAKTIKKVTTAGKVDVESGDIQDTGIYEIVYDGTDYLLQTPVANVPSTDVTTLSTTTADSSNNDNASYTTFSQTYDLLANSLAVGDVIEVFAMQNNDGGTRNMKFRLDANDIFTETGVPTNSVFRITMTVRAIGGSGSLACVLEHIKTGASPVVSAATQTLDTTQAITIDFQAQQTAGAETTHVLKSLRVLKYANP